MAGSSNDPGLGMDEPDFSGLMALTEASIRRKLSELKYTDPDLPESQTGDDPVFGSVTNDPNKSSKVSLKDSSEVKQNSSNKTLLTGSDSNTSVDKSVTPVVSELSSGSGINIAHANVTSNIMRFESALDDPELVKMVSLGLKSSKAGNDLDPRVKYCGLNVDLRSENSSPDLKQASEIVKLCGVNVEKPDEKEKITSKQLAECAPKNGSVTKVTSTSEQPSEKVKNISLPAQIDRRSPVPKVSTESVQYCGLSMELYSQSKTLTKESNSEIMKREINKDLGIKRKSSGDNMLTNVHKNDNDHSPVKHTGEEIPKEISPDKTLFDKQILESEVPGKKEILPIQSQKETNLLREEGSVETDSVERGNTIVPIIQEIADSEEPENIPDLFISSAEKAEVQSDSVKGKAIIPVIETTTEDKTDGALGLVISDVYFDDGTKNQEESLNKDKASVTKVVETVDENTGNISSQSTSNEQSDRNSKIFPDEQTDLLIQDETAIEQGTEETVELQPGSSVGLVISNVHSDISSNEQTETQTSSTMKEKCVDETAQQEEPDTSSDVQAKALIDSTVNDKSMEEDPKNGSGLPISDLHPGVHTELQTDSPIKETANEPRGGEHMEDGSKSGSGLPISDVHSDLHPGVHTELQTDSPIKETTNEPRGGEHMEDGSESGSGLLISDVHSYLHPTAHTELRTDSPLTETTSILRKGDLMEEGSESRSGLDISDVHSNQHPKVHAELQPDSPIKETTTILSDGEPMEYVSESRSGLVISNVHSNLHPEVQAELQANSPVKETATVSRDREPMEEGSDSSSGLVISDVHSNLHPGVNTELQPDSAIKETTAVPRDEESMEEGPEGSSGLVISAVHSAVENIDQEYQERCTDDNLIQSQEDAPNAEEMSADHCSKTVLPGITAPGDGVPKTTQEDTEDFHVNKQKYVESVNTESEATFVHVDKSKCSNKEFQEEKSIGNELELEKNKIRSTVSIPAELASEIQSDRVEDQLKTVKTLIVNTKSLLDDDSVRLNSGAVRKDSISDEEKLENYLTAPLQPINDYNSSEVVSDSSDDSVEIIPILTSPVNKNLSALESMLVRVTENREKGSSERQTDKPVTMSEDDVCSSSVKLLTDQNNGSEKELSAGESKVRSSDTGNKHYENQSDILKSQKHLDESSKNEVISNASIVNEKAKETVSNASIVNEKANETDSANSSLIVENTDTVQVPVTESSSLSTLDDMLMITNVRSISLDEAEQISGERNKTEICRSVVPNTTEIIGKPRSQPQVDSLIETENNSGIKITEVQSERSKSAGHTADITPVASRSHQSQTNLENLSRSSTLYAADFLSPRCSHSQVEKITGTRTDTATTSSLSRVVTSVGNVPSSSTASSGMPIITNTFTIKEEPMDYEPYGMPFNMAGSEVRPGGIKPPTCNQTLANSQKSLNKFINIQDLKGQIVNAKVISGSRNSTKVTQPVHKNFASITQPVHKNGGLPVCGNNSENPANSFVHRQKSPLTLTQPAQFRDGLEKQFPKSNLSGGNTIHYHKTIPSALSIGDGRRAKVQVVPKPNQHGAQARPIPPRPPAVPTSGNQKNNATTVKAPMNLKTINIETVGIPIITEMIARKNPIPVYKPPMPPKCVLDNGTSKQTYPCYECGDTFYLTASLEQHIYRCSMKLNYKCEWCRRILNFTNKCQLLSHLRSHMRIDKHQAVPIHIKSDSIEILTNYDDIIPGKEFQWFKIPEKDNMGNPIQDGKLLFNLSSTQLQVMTFCKLNECSECEKKFSSKDENAKRLHFAEDKKFLKPIYCDKCPMYLYNKCGIKAHQRLHKSLESDNYFVCPECGLCFDKPMLAMFLHHIRMKCFHLSRFFSIGCHKCGTNCSSIDEIRYHLTISVEQYYKCNKCPMALKTLKSFKTHCNQNHKEKSTEKEGHNKPSAKIIYRCHLCDTLIDDKEFLFSHIEKHLFELKNKAESFFHCLQCGLIFMEKKSLQYHYAQMHKTIKSENFCTLCRSTRKDQVEFCHHTLECHVAHVFKKKAGICKQCGLVCTDENVLRMHECHMQNVSFIVKGDELASKNDKTKSPKKVTEKKKTSPQKATEEMKSSFRNILPKPPPDKDKDKAVENGISSPLKKKDNPAVDGSSGEDSDHHDPIPKHLSKSCPSCQHVYSGKASRVSHLRNHRNNDEIFICMFCDFMNFNDYAEMRSHEVLCAALSKKAVRSPEKTQSTTIKLKFSKGKSSSQSKNQQKSELYQLEYKCDDCGQLFSRKEKQEEHTRLEHGIHPCHLCGLMYESHTSLKKHLLISHAGKKCVYYCWVCRKRKKFFSDVAHLEKHFTMKHKQKVWDPSKAVPALPGFKPNGKTTQAEKRRIETTPEKPDTPVKKLRIAGDKGFKCAKCSYVCEEREAFQTHIKEHKTDDAVQCIECGLCFMVIPSLKKHLFMVHKVRDFDAYFLEHNIEDVKEPEDSDSGAETADSIQTEELISVDDEPESEEDTGNPLECKVCYKTFDTDHAMKSHMRNHGMAFIKKTRRSLGPSAKRRKLDTSENNDGDKIDEANSGEEKESNP